MRVVHMFLEWVLCQYCWMDLWSKYCWVWGQLTTSFCFDGARSRKVILEVLWTGFGGRRVVGALSQELLMMPTVCFVLFACALLWGGFC